MVGYGNVLIPIDVFFNKTPIAINKVEKRVFNELLMAMIERA